MMKRLVVLFAFLVVLVGCENDVKQTSNTDNPQVQVGLLFTYEGCKVYRFLDGDYHYYVVCDKKTESTSTAYSIPVYTGKTMYYRPEEIPTLTYQIDK